jgi:hypothetical protein
MYTARRRGETSYCLSKDGNRGGGGGGTDSVSFE